MGNTLVAFGMTNLMMTGVTISMDFSVAEAPLSFMHSTGVIFSISGSSSGKVISYRATTVSMDFLKHLGALAELLFDLGALISRD
eukprot:11512125-Ditylum_brightwellii.AAC.1